MACGIGGLGKKTKPRTGVHIFGIQIFTKMSVRHANNNDYAKMPPAGVVVAAELNVNKNNNKPVVLVSFAAPWPLAPTNNGPGLEEHGIFTAIARIGHCSSYYYGKTEQCGWCFALRPRRRLEIFYSIPSWDNHRANLAPIMVELRQSMSSWRLLIYSRFWRIIMTRTTSKQVVVSIGFPLPPPSYTTPGLRENGSTSVWSPFIE